MVLVQKQTYRSKEQNRELGNKPFHLWLIYNKGGKNIQWRKVSSINSTGTTEHLGVKQ